MQGKLLRRCPLDRRVPGLAPSGDQPQARELAGPGGLDDPGPSQRRARQQDRSGSPGRPRPRLHDVGSKRFCAGVPSQTQRAEHQAPVREKALLLLPRDQLRRRAKPPQQSRGRMPGGGRVQIAMKPSHVRDVFDQDRLHPQRPGLREQLQGCRRGGNDPLVPTDQPLQQAAGPHPQREPGSQPPGGVRARQPKNGVLGQTHVAPRETPVHWADDQGPHPTTRSRSASLEAHAVSPQLRQLRSMCSPSTRRLRFRANTSVRLPT